MVMDKTKSKPNQNTKWWVIPTVVFLLALVAGFVFDFVDEGQLTGAFTAQTGQLNQIEGQKKDNPNYGALSGTLTFTIKSGTTIISEDIGSNYLLYFSMHDISDWNLVKNDTQAYSGTLTGVDADGSGSVCTTADFTTLRKYYDSDNDNIVDPQEFYIYAILTNSQGCFAVKLPPGSYDIYG